MTTNENRSVPSASTAILEAASSARDKLSKNPYGHLFVSERVRLFDVMDEVFGKEESMIRQGVLGAFVGCPMISAWKSMVDTLEKPEQWHVHSYLDEALEKLMAFSIYWLRMATPNAGKTFTRLLSRAEVICALIPDDDVQRLVLGIEKSCFEIVRARRALGDSAFSKEEEEEFRANYLNIDEFHPYGEEFCDWSDSHFFGAYLIAGPLETHSRVARSEFWIEWIDDYLDVNSKTLSDLLNCSRLNAVG